MSLCASPCSRIKEAIFSLLFAFCLTQSNISSCIKHGTVHWRESGFRAGRLNSSSHEPSSKSSSCRRVQTEFSTYAGILQISISPLLEAFHMMSSPIDFLYFSHRSFAFAGSPNTRTVTNSACI